MKNFFEPHLRDGQTVAYSGEMLTQIHTGWQDLSDSKTRACFIILSMDQVEPEVIPALFPLPCLPEPFAFAERKKFKTTSKLYPRVETERS